MTFTSVVSNVGTLLDFCFGSISVQNSGATSFVLGAYQHTLEYYSLSSGTWIPFARNPVAADGTPLTDPDVQTIRYEVMSALGGDGVTYTGNPIVGTSIQPGATAIFIYRLSPVIPAETVNVAFDPVESGGLRLALHFDAPSGPGYTSYADLGAAFEGYAGAVTDVGAQLAYDDPPTSPIGLSSTEVGPLAPGATRIFSGTVPSPLPRTRDQFASDSAYTFELYAGGLFPYSVRVTPTGLGFGGVGAGATSQYAQIARQLPYMAASKAGPAQGNAGLRLPFPVRLDAYGNATSYPLAITDSLDGVLMDSNATLPGALAPGQSATATLFAASPLDRPPGPATDEAAVTWADRNGNVYGPVHSSFTTSLLAGHPEGYLSLAGETGSDLPGETAELTATVQNGLGQPVAGVTVHFTVTGPNATSGNVVSDAAGQAVFTYSGGAAYGTDTIIASATPISAPLQSAPVHRIWAQPNGTPCTGRKDPLDVLLVIDASPSMATDQRYRAAEAAAGAFIDNLDPVRDQVGAIVFMGEHPARRAARHDARAGEGRHDREDRVRYFLCDWLCPGSGTDIPGALDAALDEFAGPRHRAGAQPVMVFISDGGNTGPEPAAAFARLAASGVRSFSIGVGSDVDFGVMRSIASTPNDFFLHAVERGMAWAFGSLNQDLCRNRPPLVRAGGNQGLYNVRLPETVALNGEVHDDGAAGDSRLTSTWSLVSGPAPVTFADASSPVTAAVFTAPGTYVLRLAATDGYLTVADQASITIDAEPSLAGANLAIALASPGPIDTGGTETVTATLTDPLGAPIARFPVALTVTGANPTTGTQITNAAGQVVFAYQGQVVGTDAIHATALGSTTRSAPRFFPCNGPTGTRSSHKDGSPAPRTRPASRARPRSPSAT